MKTKCPTCGAIYTLDALIGATEAGQAFLAALQAPPSLSSDIIKYLGLFHPAKSELSFKRAAMLLAELTPHINAQCLTYKQITTPAPVPAWHWAINQMLDKRDAGELTLPLKSHNYLYSVVQGYKPSKDDAARACDAEQTERTAKPMTDKQINHFAKLLANDATFGSQHAQIGEDAYAFARRIASALKDPKTQAKWADELARVGYQVNT